MDKVEQVIRGFIVDNFLFGDTGRMPPNEDSLLERGIVDSTGVLELVFYLEETYGIAIDTTELVPANLDSVSRAAGFIRRKIAAR